MDNYIISSIVLEDTENLIDSSKKSDVLSCGQLKKNRSDVVGIPIYSITKFLGRNDNSNEVYKIIKATSPNGFPLTLNIDYRLIKDKELLSILKNKLGNSFHAIRIIGKDYELTYEDFQKLNFFNCIFVDKVDSAIKTKQVGEDEYLFQERVIVEQKNKYIKSIGYEYIDDKPNMCFNYYVDKIESFDDIKKITNSIKNSFLNKGNTKIRISYQSYDINNYLNILRAFDEEGLNSDVTFEFIANPIKDDVSLFKKIKDNTKFNIEIKYTTSEERIDSYKKEPVADSRFYHSEIDVEGETTLDNYLDVLEKINEVENHIKEKGYSPLESMIYVYKMLQEEYLYDYSEELDEIDYNRGRDLDKIINNNKMVCVGFANLYSVLLRKIGIDVFKYSTTGHVRNIARLQDRKYNIDNISLLDPTWDSTSVGEDVDNKYTFFMFSIKDSLKMKELLTVPSTLVLKQDEVSEFEKISKPPIEKFLNISYSQNRVAKEMLYKMNLLNNKDSDNEFERIKHILNDSDVFEEIKYDVLIDAISNVYKSENSSLTNLDQITRSLENRTNLFKRKDLDNRFGVLVEENGQCEVKQVETIGKNKKKIISNQ